MREVVLLEYDNHIIGMYCSFNDNIIIGGVNIHCVHYAPCILLLIAQNMTIQLHPYGDSSYSIICKLTFSVVDQCRINIFMLGQKKLMFKIMQHSLLKMVCQHRMLHTETNCQASYATHMVNLATKPQYYATGWKYGIIQIPMTVENLMMRIILFLIV